MNEYLVKCWVKVKAQDKREAENITEAVLLTACFNAWVDDYKILDTVELDKITAEWEA